MNPGCERPRATARRRLRGRLVAALALLGAAASGCNVIDAALAGPGRIVKMVPGGNVATGGLECWLTLEFSELPPGTSPRDIRVRFSGLALAEPAEFDWAFIAAHDVIANGGEFGSGNRDASATHADAPPPPGEPIKVKFQLDAKPVIAEATDTLVLEAELLVAGVRTDRAQRTIEHVYSRTSNAYF